MAKKSVLKKVLKYAPLKTEFARAVATEILFMEAGRVIEQGSPEELLAPGAQTRTQDFCTRLLELCGEAAPAQEAQN